MSKVIPAILAPANDGWVDTHETEDFMQPIYYDDCKVLHKNPIAIMPFKLSNDRCWREAANFLSFKSQHCSRPALTSKFNATTQRQHLHHDGYLNSLLYHFSLGGIYCPIRKSSFVNHEQQENNSPKHGHDD